MKKYFYIFKNSLSEYFAYRLNFFLWRLRVIITVLINFFLWQAIFQSNKNVFGYQEPQILTYMILITLIESVVLSTQTQKVAYEINSGALSRLLIVPINFFTFNFIRDLSDKTINTICAMIEIPFLLIILKPPVYIQTNFLWLILFVFTLIFAAIIYFEINMILSFIGFWSKETWAPRFIFYILLMFLAGNYFPLDILPHPLYQIFLLMPFSYLVFFPLKIYLGNLTFSFVFNGLVVALLWIFLLWYFMYFLWNRGLKVYTAEGI